METAGTFIVSGIFTLLPELLILAACVFYLTIRVETDGILLIAGSLIAILATTYYSIVMPILMTSGALDPSMGAFQTINIVVRVIAILGTVLFAAGLFILFDKIKAQQEA